jgi:hypothetical protein
MSAPALSYERSTLPSIADRRRDTARVGRDDAAQEAINRQIEAERYVARSPMSTEPYQPEENAFFPVPEFRPLPAKAEQVFAAAKEWEGFVQEVGNSHFIAELRELRGKGGEVADTAEIPIGDIPAADRKLLREGAVFRYLVGYAKSSKGVTRKRHVYFRRGKVTQDATEQPNWLALAALFRD